LRHIRDPLPATLLALTFVTGVVDAVSFLGLGRVFSANQTGNVVFLGFAWAGASGLSATASIVSLLAFAVGAAVRDEHQLASDVFLGGRMPAGRRPRGGAF
jgi:uncharacterized membrane protein YoaK (UPF0700 family)